ncbi:response regulator [Larkinella soli]|uniref:response regulator n=1 Tax=Larkinella soli TaxID=1770527 RepID=UPI000FFB2058|nr:response regulator [Larkinella soli]
MSQLSEVVMIDDDPEECELFKILAGQEWPAVAVTCIDQQPAAWSYLEQAEPLPRLLVVDVRMRGETTLELVRRIKQEERLKQIPVVILSGTEEHRETYLEAGVEAFQLKPDGLEEYFALIRGFRALYLL